MVHEEISEVNDNTKKLLAATAELSQLFRATRRGTRGQRRTVRQRLVWMALESNMDALRLVLALSALLWAFLLFLPGDTFTRPTYALMARMAPEHAWASAFLFQGAAMLWSLVTGTANRTLFVIDAALGCLLWTTSCVAMLFAVFPVPAAISAEIVSAFASWWVMARYPGVKRHG